MTISEERIKKANRDFYDIVGAAYEELDGRRTDSLKEYVVSQLKNIQEQTTGDTLLDLGCGSGFISSLASPLFKKRYAMDLSCKIIHAIKDAVLAKFSADSDYIPLKDNQMDVVVSFAFLHHCYAFEKLCTEIFRILKPGGIFYADHDMDRSFYNKFKGIMRIYRKIHNAKKHYLKRFNNLSADLYDFSEFHQEGIPSDLIQSQLKKAGFREVKIFYHWYGLSPFTDRIFGAKTHRKGWAPLAKIMAIK